MGEGQARARQALVVLAARLAKLELALPVALVGKVALPDLFLHAMRILAIDATQATTK
jgi:hypothetical protein